MAVTAPAAIALIVATICLFVAALFARVARAPRSEPMRWFSLLAATAAIASATDSLGSLSIQADWLVAANRVGLSAIGVHGAAWLHYLAALESRPLTRFERTVRLALVGLALGALVPGLLFSGEVGLHEVAWLGVRYQDPRPTALGALCFGLLSIALAYPFAHWLRRAWRRLPGARAHAIGIGVLWATTINDALATSGLVATPMLLEVGFLSVIGLAGLSLVQRFVVEGARLQALQGALEQRVATRSLEQETALRELARQEQASSLVRLAGGLAHELNGPSAVVSSTLSFLAEPDVTDEERQSARRDARDALQRMRRILTRLGRVGLASRPHAPSRSLVTLAPLLDEISGRYAGLVEVRLEPGAAGRLGARIPAEALEEVVEELVENARRAFERAGRPGRVTLSAERRGALLELYVDDDGPGIPAERLANLLEPFGNLSRHDERPALGLPAAAGLLRAVGGQLEVRARDGGGTRAIVTLPFGGKGDG